MVELYRSVWSTDSTQIFDIIRRNVLTNDIINNTSDIIYHYLFVKDRQIYYAAVPTYYHNSNPDGGALIKSYQSIPEEFVMVRFKYLDFIWDLQLTHLLGSVVLNNDNILFLFYENPIPGIESILKFDELTD